MSDSTLANVSDESLPKLRDFYKINWPTHILAFNFLSKTIDRFEKHPEQRNLIKIYSINGKVEEDATFIAVINDLDIYVSTLDSTCDRLKIALKGLKLDSKYLFVSVAESYKTSIDEFLGSSDFNLIADEKSTMVHLSCEDALKLTYDVPEGLVIRKISNAKDVEKINSVWPYTKILSENYLALNAKENMSVGLFNEKTGELLASCQEHHFGYLLALQANSDHLRKGYATIVTKAICKQMAEERGLDIFTHIVYENFKSKNLFKKIGFAEVKSIYFIGIVKE